MKVTLKNKDDRGSENRTKMDGEMKEKCYKQIKK